MVKIGCEPVVGIVANPVSARDIRRVVSNAGSLQIADRANIVLCVLAGLKAGGINKVIMMPDTGGIRAYVERGISHRQKAGGAPYPDVDFLEMPLMRSVADTHLAAKLMQEKGVDLIVVLGGDGTHRAVVSIAPDIAIAGISTGTNNAFPERREPTVTGLAAALSLTGNIAEDIAFHSNKILDVHVEGHSPDIALVDVAVVTDRYIGAKAVWKTQTISEIFVTFADSNLIGLSAVAGLLKNVGRREKGGLAVQLADPKFCKKRLQAPIAPGMVEMLGIEGVRSIFEGEECRPIIPAGSLALDGERELSFDSQQNVTIKLRENAFRTVNIPGIMHYATENGLLCKIDK